MIDPLSAMRSAMPVDSAADKSDKTVGQQFEAMLVRTLMKEVRKSMPKNAMGGKHMEMFGDLFDQEIANSISRSGGLGFADSIDQRRTRVPTSAPAPRLFNPQTSPSVTSRAAHRISSAYGVRVDPINGSRRMHHGVDIAAPKGTGIRAVQGGTITFAGERGSYGKMVVVDHGGGLSSRYAHCQEIRVSVGQKVPPGRTIATVGSTGRSTGPHLHFETRKDGKPVNPSELFRDPIKKVLNHDR